MIKVKKIVPSNKFVQEAFEISCERPTEVLALAVLTVKPSERVVCGRG